MIKKLGRLLAENQGLVILLLAALLLRMPSLWEPNWYGDEGIYLTLGQALRKGIVLYREIHDNKPPLIYWLAAWAGSQFWLRFILLWWNLATLIAFFSLAKKLVKDKRKALIASLIWLGLIILHEGNIANSEIFWLLPSIVALRWLLTDLKNDWLKFGGVGALLAVSFLFKVPAGLDLATAGLVVFVFWQENVKEVWLRLFDRRLWWLVAGFIIPTLMIVGYYGIRGAGTDYIQAAWLQNIGYLSSWKTGTQALTLSTLMKGMGFRAIVLAIFLLGTWWQRKYFSKEFLLISVWLLLSYFGALLSERPYPHYLIQVVPALALALIWLWLTSWKRKREKVWLISWLAVMYLAYQMIGFWYYPVFGYYKNFSQFVLGLKTKRDYFNYFDPKTAQIYDLAAEIMTRTKLNDKIFIWGDEPHLYVLSRRLPATKYVVAYHIVDFNKREETIKQIEEKQPTLIIWMKSERREFNQLKRLIMNNYHLEVETNSAKVYHLLLKNEGEWE